MSRSINATLLTALASGTVEPFYAVEMNFDSGDLRLWTGIGDTTINSDTYTGAGNLLSISGLEEVADLSAKGITIEMSGVNSSILSLALTEPYQNRTVSVYFGVMGVTPVATLFSGFADTMAFQDSGDSMTVTLTVESKLIMLEKPKERRYNQESQQTRYPGDTFFSFVADLQDKEITWGKASPGGSKKGGASAYTRWPG